MNHRFLRNKLQTVAVACCDNAFVAVVLAGVGEGAENVVSLVALAGDDFIAQKREKLLEHGHLRGELLRHTLAVCLVAVVSLVAEGGRF